MTVTYDLTTDIGKVRLTTGDKTVSDPIFTDEELQVFLDNNGDDINLASADALEAWAAQYGANVDSEKIGDYNYSQSIITKLLSMAKALRDKAASAPAIAWAEPDLLFEEDEDE